MTLTAEVASELFRERVSQMILGRAEGPEPAPPLTRAEVAEILSWISACNYHSAMELARIRDSGVEIVRDDGKPVDLWIVEQVQLGNRAGQALSALEER